MTLGLLALAAGCSDPVAEPDAATNAAPPVQVQFRVVEEQVPDTGTGNATSEGAGVEADLDAVWDKIGQEARDLAESLKEPATVPGDLEILAPFAELSPAEVAVLPPAVQFYVPAVSCAQLGARDMETIDPKSQSVSCDQPSDQAPVTKYLLAAAGLESSDLAGASSAPSASSPGDFTVTMTMTDGGADKWAQLSGDNVERQIAIVTGIGVLAAPTVMAPITGGTAEIAGDYTAEEAAYLAAQIEAGAAG